MLVNDTIAAIATPLGEGGLAVIRLSGPQALVVADRSFIPVGKASSKASAASTHTIHYGRIERQGRVVDEVLMAVLRAPRTYTREDVVEISWPRRPAAGQAGPRHRIGEWRAPGPAR